MDLPHPDGPTWISVRGPLRTPAAGSEPVQATRPNATGGPLDTKETKRAVAIGTEVASEGAAAYQGQRLPRLELQVDALQDRDIRPGWVVEMDALEDDVANDLVELARPPGRPGWTHEEPATRDEFSGVGPKQCIRERGRARAPGRRTLRPSSESVSMSGLRSMVWKMVYAAPQPVAMDEKLGAA